MRQRSLPWPRPRNPIARATDPATSHRAAFEVTTSGTRDLQAKAVLELLKAHPGATSAELGTVGAYDRYVVARRLPELEKLGFAKRGPARACGVTGRQAMTWEVVWRLGGPLSSPGLVCPVAP